MDKRSKIEEQLQNMDTERLIEAYNENLAANGEEIYENNSSFWNERDETRYELMELVDRQEINLCDTYVICNNYDYTTSCDIADLINWEELVDLFCENKDICKEYDVKYETSLEDIYNQLGKIISGLTKAFPMLESKNYDSLKYLIQNQVSALTDLKKDVEEKAQEEDE